MNAIAFCNIYLTQSLQLTIHFIEQPIDATWSFGPLPVLATSFIASKRSLFKSTGPASFLDASNLPLYCSS